MRQRNSLQGHPSGSEADMKGEKNGFLSHHPSLDPKQFPNGLQGLGYRTAVLEGHSKGQATATREPDGPQSTQSLVPRSSPI